MPDGLARNSASDNISVRAVAGAAERLRDGGLGAAKRFGIFSGRATDRDRPQRRRERRGVAKRKANRARLSRRNVQPAGSAARCRLGFIAYVAIKLVSERWRDINFAVAIIAAAFMAKIALS